MKKYFVKFGFGLAVIAVLLLIVAVIASLTTMESDVVTRFAIGFLVIALIDLALFANMLRRISRPQEEEVEAGQ